MFLFKEYIFVKKFFESINIYFKRVVEIIFDNEFKYPFDYCFSDCTSNRK